MSDWYHVKPDGSIINIGDGFAYARQHGEIMQPIEDRRVAYTGVTEGVSVSTVFLGLDHRMTGTDGPPILWETLVFADAYPEINEDGERYTSREDAERGHAAWVERARAAVEGK